MPQSVATNIFASSWSRETLRENPDLQKGLPVIYLAGCIGYSFSCLYRVGKVVYHAFSLICALWDALKQRSLTPLKLPGKYLLGSLAEVPIAAIGVVCPPLAYQLDGWLKTIREPSLIEQIAENLGFQPRQLVDIFSGVEEQERLDREAEKIYSPLIPVCQTAAKFWEENGIGELPQAAFIRLLLAHCLIDPDEDLSCFGSRSLVLNEHANVEGFLHRFQTVRFDGGGFKSKLLAFQEEYGEALQQLDLTLLLQEEKPTNADCAAQIYDFAATFCTEDRRGAAWLYKEGCKSVPWEELFGESIRDALQKALSHNLNDDQTRLMMLYYRSQAWNKRPEGDEETSQSGELVALEELAAKLYDVYQTHRETPGLDQQVLEAVVTDRDGGNLAALIKALKLLDLAYKDEEGAIFTYILRECKKKN